jgi:hypothetical protein
METGEERREARMTKADFAIRIVHDTDLTKRKRS